MVLLSTVGRYPKQNWGSTSSISSIQKQNLGSPSSSTYPKQKFGSSSGGPSMVKPTTVIGGVSQPKPPVNNFGGKPTPSKGASGGKHMIQLGVYGCCLIVPKLT